MDPLTLGLIAGGLFAAYRIKRASMPPKRIMPKGTVPELTFFGGIPPHAFGGGLRPPVTHRAITKERPLERSREGGAREDEEEKELKITLGTSRAQEAIASSATADVVGGERITTPVTSYTRPIYTGPPLPGGGIGAPKRTGDTSSVFGIRR